MPGAPVVVGREHLRDGILQAVIVNSKNANVATSQGGVEDSKRICELVAAQCGIEPGLVLPSSTGVIGRRLPMDVIKRGCATLVKDFGKTERHIENFARSIMTTDTRPKRVSASLDGATILGIAKGAGMIEPNMATMLCYFATDAAPRSKQRSVTGDAWMPTISPRPRACASSPMSISSGGRGFEGGRLYCSRGVRFPVPFFAPAV